MEHRCQKVWTAMDCSLHADLVHSTISTRGAARWMLLAELHVSGVVRLDVSRALAVIWLVALRRCSARMAAGTCCPSRRARGRRLEPPCQT